MDGVWTHTAGELGNISLLPIQHGGHSYYVRKCLGPDIIDGIYMPNDLNTVRDCNRWNEVLAVGPNVGKRCSKLHAKAYKRPRHIGDPARVGDWLLVPKHHGGILQSELIWYEYFIEESICWAICRVEDQPDLGSEEERPTLALPAVFSGTENN